jgi:hypothetical protein
MDGEGRADEVLILLDAKAIVFVLEPAALREDGVHLVAGVHEESEMVVAR